MTQVDTGTEDLSASVDDGVAVLTFNRPERRNALSSAMLNAWSPAPAAHFARVAM
jgi:2-(1,2-epoxy-1,2-dihydrophenyl)acetyl-CoA isomerase